MLLAMCLPPRALWALEAGVTDDRGKTIRLERPARRIVCLHGGLSDVLLVLDKADAIAGRTTADDDTPALAHVPAVGTHLRPNLELILSLAPDLVLQHAGREEAGEPLNALESLNIPTAAFAMDDFPALFAAMERVAVLVDAGQTGAQRIQDLKDRLEAVRRQVQDRERLTVLVEIRYPNLLVAGRGSLASHIVEAAGGRQLVMEDARHVRLSEETLLRLNPQACLMQRGPMNPNPEPYVNRPHYQHLDCVKHNRTLVVEGRKFARTGPAAVDAVEELAAWLHGGAQ
ncbi:ABC transporter substrate-binding protein [Megalodesulfovibrio gigas]|uniref:ABC transporter substrate-binding protein n=1 Tax=Megalodesulfovibrio gigas TaxID=879 RepID=UPI001F4575E7|nr:ABC transporter substrate-binding protein [Megalodesulfovibrio gigas]